MKLLVYKDIKLVKVLELILERLLDRVFGFGVLIIVVGDIVIGSVRML